MLSKDWKLIMTDSNNHIVHARGCDHIANWVIDRDLELYKLRPNKHNICRCCKYLVYTTLGATDYVANVSVYKRIFKSVPNRILKELFVDKKAKCQIYGDRVYFKVKGDSFYIDFSYDTIRLFHGNYKVSARESGRDDYACGGYHEHKIGFPKIEPTMKDALRAIASYNYKDAEAVHKKNRKKKTRMILSEYDPESYRVEG